MRGWGYVPELRAAPGGSLQEHGDLDPAATGRGALPSSPAQPTLDLGLSVWSRVWLTCALGRGEAAWMSLHPQTYVLLPHPSSRPEGAAGALGADLLSALST